MHRSVLVLASVLIVGSAIPTATLAWRSNVYDGTEEPSTTWDVPSRMWQGPNQEAVDRIYFDAQVWREGTGMPSPNTDATKVRNYGRSSFAAMLGYWRDCNTDSFIGDVRIGAAIYPVELGIDQAICPPGSAYNDGTFAYEFLHIGPEADDTFDGATSVALCNNDVLCQRGGWNYIRDDAADAWHDWDLATDPPPPTRLLLPLPQGTLSDTNGHFQYIDSYTFGSLSGTGGPGCRAKAPDGSIQACWVWPSSQAKDDTDGPGGVRASAHPNQCDSNDPVNGAITALSAAPNGPDPADCPSGGTSPIPNAPNPVTAEVRDRVNDSTSPGGTGPSGTPLVKPWDYGPRGDRDATNDKCELRDNPADWEFNPDGAIDPTSDHIWAAVVPGITSNDPCSNNPANGGPNVGNLEAPSTPADVAGKVAANSGMGFGVSTHFNPSETLGAADIEVCVPGVGGADFPTYCGGLWTGGNWIHSHGVTALNPVPFDTYVATFYADVTFADVFGGALQPRFNVVDRDGNALVPNDPATALPGGGNNVHTYGEENCPVGRGTIATGTWACDPLRWIAAAQLDPADPDDAQAIYLLPKVGKGYDLRDVECYDNSAQGTSINDLVKDATGIQGDLACPDLPPPPFP